MICDICGNESARIRYVNRSYGKGKNLFVIEQIPIISCTQCKESYFTAETLHEIERIKLHWKSFALKRRIPVAAYV